MTLSGSYKQSIETDESTLLFSPHQLGESKIWDQKRCRPSSMMKTYANLILSIWLEIYLQPHAKLDETVEKNAINGEREKKKWIAPSLPPQSNV